MTKRGLWLWTVTVLLLATFVQPVWANPNPAPPTAGKNAGRISALLPVAKITRGTGRAAVSSEAKRGDELVWNDLVKTEKGGRARITLADQSILSLGSQSELRIVKHDARAQQTSLQMAYGRVRAQVASITRERGSFELRTPTAVAGVIGTDFGVDSSAVGGDTFVCLGGAVQVSNSDPNVAGSVQCNAGQTTTVMPGKSPTTPKPATLQQLQQLIEDTESSIIASISPAAALPGTNFDSTIAGAKMGKVKSVSVTGGSGVNASIKSSTDIFVVVHIVIDQTAPAGPRTLTLEKESGASSATVFTVLGGITGDPKKAYLETIEQLRTTGVSGLSAFLAGAQQAADQVAQQITSANQNLPKPLDLTPFANSLHQQYTGVQGDMSTSTEAIAKAASEAANTFGSLYDSAYQQLLQRDPAGTPDSTFTASLTNAFTQANGVLQSAIGNAQTGLTSTIQNYGQSLDQIQNTWSQSINDAFQAQQAGPLPKVNALERIVELGAEASFDASRSSASNASTSINSFKWVLCDKSYQPSGFGQPLPENASGCNTLPGYGSTASEFVIPTCSLQPGPYFARLEVTDSNNKTSRMDVRLTVLQPGYGSPAEALRGLADGYSTLQLSEFMKWFDRTLFQGYTSLSENVRQTLETLSSMNINLRVSQENSTCNDATVRADWQQNYTFATDPKTVLTQQEQLTVAMKRTPGVGWLITEFRGDNGQVQGVPPAISNPDVSAPSIIVTCISPGEQCALPGAVRTAGRNGIPTSPNGIFAVIQNVGSAPLTTPLKVRFEVGGQTEHVDIPIPFAPSEGPRQVFSTLTFPPSPTGVTLTVTVNPDRALPEVNFENHTRSITASGVPDYVVTSVSFQGHNAPYNLQRGETLNLVVTVSNIGGTSASGTLQLTANCGVQNACPGPEIATIDAPAAGSSVTASFPLLFDLPVGTYPGSVSIATQIPDAIVGPAFNQAFNVVDFALTTVPQSVLTGVAGRAFNTSAVTITPANYPLTLSYNYTGLPSGLHGSGASITGTPSAGTVQPATVTVSATAFGVTHGANLPIQVDIASEIVLTPGPAVAFIAAGAPQNVVFDLIGGIYPVTINLTLPNGFTSAANATVNGVMKPVTVNGNIASFTTAGSGQVIFSLAADNAAATGTSLNFSVRATDAGYAATNTAPGNVTASLPYTLAGIPDLQFGTVTLPANLQMGDSASISIPVTNSGSAAANAGWSVDVTVNGQSVGSATGPQIPATQTVHVPVTLQVPQIAPPPGSITSPFVATLNANQAVQESSTANNTFNGQVTVNDFTLSAKTFVAKGVTGRTFNFPAVTVQPSPYPLPVNVSYAGLVSGLAASTNVGTDNLLGSTILGTPSAITTGDQNITAIGTVGAVSHNANQQLVLNVTGEISLKPGVTPTFTAGGAQAMQSVAVVVQGGIYPVTLNLTLPQGFTSAAAADVGGSSTPVNIAGSVASVTLTSAAMVTYTLTANNTVAAGAGLNFIVNATDLGYSSPLTGAIITPAGNVSANIPYNVSGLPDLQFGAVSIPSTLQMGDTATLNLPVQNTGNAGAAAGWDVVATINGVTAGAATVAALSANQSTIVNLLVTVPQTDPPPANKSYPVLITLNASNLIQESNTANNTFTSSTNLVDFALTTQAASVLGVAGRAFDFVAVDIAPAPYPITPVSVGFSALPTGITQQPGISANGLNGSRIAGTPTAAGNTGINISGSLNSVTHSASSPLQVIVSSEITMTQVGTTGLQTGGPAQAFTIAVSGGVYPITVKLTLPSGVTTTDGSLGTGFSTQTIAAPGNVTWNLTAGVTAVNGSNLPISVLATDAGIPQTATPAGNVLFNGLYSIGGTANYVVTGVSWQNHTAPYTGAQALQFGENAVLLVTVQNQGSASPSGTITVTANCNAPQCSPPLVATGATPAAGQSITIPVDAPQMDLAVGSYLGTVDITVDNGGLVGPQATLPFDVVDFAFTANTLAGGGQNLLIGGSGVLNFSLAVQVPQGSPFGILITPSTYSNLSFTPAAQTVAGASIDFTVNVGAAQPATGGASDIITFTATNHGVSKAVNVPVVFFNAMLQPQNLFVNDAANPLVVPIAASGQTPGSYPTVNLKMAGNYAGGDAPLTIQQPCGPFVANAFPAAASPGALVSLPIYAATGNTCPAGTPLIVNASIQNTRPSLTIPVYTVYLAPKGLSALSLVKATPSRDISTVPWYSGEGLDWDVDVQNTGAADSAGNEKISIYLSYNGRDTFIGSVINPTPIPKAQTATIRVHSVGYDVFKDDPTQSGFGNVRVTLAAGDPKDLSPTAQDLIFSVNLENWYLANVGDGGDDANALPIGPGSLNGTDVQLASKFGNQFPPGFQVTLVPGAYSKPQFDVPAFAPSFLSEGGTSTVTVTMPDQATPYSGYYYAQVIAQLKDGGTITAQRETTIHFTVSSGTNTAIIDLASDVKNIAPCPTGVCGAPPSTLQVNGPLPEPFNLTASVNGCTGTCTGSADIHFTDNYQTITTPISQTVDLVAPSNVLNGRVKAADNPDGSINIGPATVNISVTNIQAAKAGAARTPTPQPVGDNQYIMAVNIGDIEVNSFGCIPLVPGNSTPVAIPISWNVQGGFNVPTLNWEWQDANHVPVAASPISFNFGAGASNFSGGTYEAIPAINVTNVSDGTIGLVTHYFAVTVSNSLGSATKYFPFVFDLSQGQTLCPLGNAARGSSGLTPIRGSWGKAGLSAPVSSVRVAAAKTTTTKLPDVQINATDVSFSPSYPKAGDTVSVRFRLTNTGDADAKAVPVALQINGTTVVSDTFDVAAGKSTLAGLQWSNAQLPASVSDVSTIKPAALKEKLSRNLNAPDTASMTAALVVDPQHTIAQKTATAKTATLAHFRMQPGTGVRDSIGVSADQRVVLALGEGACAALRFAVGAGFCPRGDVTVSVDDLAKGTYKLESDNGVADLGFNNFNYTNASFSSQVLAQSGHNYAVKLDGGPVGILTLQAVRNPEQLSEAAKRLFRQRAVLVVKGLGSGTGAPDVGGLANRLSDAMVYFDIVYQGQ